MGLFSKLFPNANDREIKKLDKKADEIEALGEEYKALSEEQLKAKTAEFKERLEKGETLDDIMVEAYATVREASSRVLGLRHFHVQLMGGIALHQGRIAQMATGEGKTLVATLPAYLNALSGEGMHIVTVNDYLAKRDAEWMGKVYKYLGLTVGVIVPQMDVQSKQAAYNCDIIYATNNELGFDYLRDNMIVEIQNKMQRKLNFAIVDEVDSILIDEARTPLIISGMGEKSSDTYTKADSFAKSLLGKEISYYIKFAVKGEKNTYFLARTTKPYTLLSNVALRVNGEENYATVKTKGENYILAESLVDKYFDEAEVIETQTGAELEGLQYYPLFDMNYTDKTAYYVVCDNNMSIDDDGTGIESVAPAFGGYDANISKQFDLPVIQSVGKDGKYLESCGEPFDRMVAKDSDRAVASYLRDRRLYFSESMGNYIVEEKEKTVRLSDEGVAKAEKYFNLENYADIENQDLAHHINNALRANVIMKRDVDYVVKDGEVVIVDEFTGRLMEGRRYSEGLHQAIEAKEKVSIRAESKTLATITFQNFFRLYKKLSGMTGTAKTEEKEFNDIYNLDVVVLPTNKPILRIDENDKLFTTKKGKIKAIVKDIAEHHATGQPILVGTANVEDSEALSKILKANKINHNVLNAKNHKSEAEIIAQAGKIGAVTIATNMAGRGTDIMLGGNAEYLAKERMEKDGYSEAIIAEATSYATITDTEILKAREEYHKLYDMFKQGTDKEKEQVRELGGLRIVGTCRNDSRRIDDQLRGRSGRQGDPGSSVFYLSMEDDMLRVFGGETMQSIANRLNVEEDQAIELAMLTKQIEHAQARIEGRDFSIRKSVLAYDDVMNVQRNLIYGQRNEVLNGLDMSNQIEKMIIEQVEIVCNNYIDMTVGYMSWDYAAFNNALEQRVLADGTNIITEELCSCYNPIKIRDTILDEVFRQYDEKVAAANEIGVDFQEVERVVLLKNVDSKWMDHIDSLHRLRKGIGLMAYGQKDPVVAYKNNAIDMFDEMIDAINRDTVTTLCKGVLSAKVERKQVAEETGTNESTTVVNKDKKIGRNDPCPCGSGRKYKNCCGK